MYTPYLEDLLRRRGLSPADSSDVIQETFVAIVDHIGDFQYDPTRRFRGWLATIALRKASRHMLRAKRKHRALGGTTNLDKINEHSGDLGPGEAEERRLSMLLGRWRVALGELEWKVVEWTVLRDVSIDEAAKSLGIAVGYLYVCRSRARKTLLRLMEEGDE